jgi:hypothetical protein
MSGVSFVRWTAIACVAVLVLTAGVALARQELAGEQVPMQEPGLQDASGASETSEASEAVGQEVDPAAPPVVEPGPVVDPSAPIPQAGSSSREEEALRLVEQILEEQRGLVAGQNFVYRSEGRRDPFRNLLQLRQREIVAPTNRPAGLAGFLIGEVEITAVAMFQGRWHALLIGLDRRTYTAEVGTDMYDGRVVEINNTEIVFEQEVEDLIGARSTRRVVKKLTSGNE